MHLKQVQNFPPILHPFHNGDLSSQSNLYFALANEFDKGRYNQFEGAFNSLQLQYQ